MCTHEGCGPVAWWAAEECHGHHHGHGGYCCCGPSFGGRWPVPFRFRQFWTKEEKIEALERYLEDLRKEAQAVEEELKKLREG